jgi:hypothetical protein
MLDDTLDMLVELSETVDCEDGSPWVLELSEELLVLSWVLELELLGNTCVLELLEMLLERAWVLPLESEDEDLIHVLELELALEVELLDSNSPSGDLTT